MKPVFYFLMLLVTISLFSCKSKPSKEDISKKILMEYVCPENAKVNNLNIINTKETESMFGLPALQFTVSGEVEWSAGCDEAFGTLPAGYKEKFDNKMVTLVKSDNGWQ